MQIVQNSTLVPANISQLSISSAATDLKLTLIERVLYLVKDVSIWQS